MAAHATNLTVLPAGVESERSSHRHRVTSPDLRSVMERAHGVASPEDSGSSGEEASTSKPLGESLKFHFKTKKTSDSQESLPVRRISLVGPSQGRGAIKPLKEGFVLHQTGGLSRWSKRYCSIEGHHLFIAKNPKEKLREEILLKDATVVEKSTKNINHVFTVMTPHQQIVLAGNSRREMDEWMGSVRVAAASAQNKGVIESTQHLDGQHSWFSCSHSRFTYCNVCGEALHGVAWHGLSCEVCRFKSHRRCVFNVKQSCKWATVTSLEKDGADVLPDFSFPHQWLEGNLLPGSKCVICKKACGSTKRLQDFRCIWCKWTVHTDCQDAVQPLCNLGSHRISILPPSLVRRSDAIMEGMWEPYKVSGHSPVLAFVNSKSGDNKGVRFLRKLKTWLNPLQVFDLAISGPEPGLMLFQRMEKFRVLVFGGDGSVGWTLSAIDKFQLHHKCMLGVIPLGTGNDLARVLGWGAQCSDEEKIPQLLTEMEQSTFKYLDRWSVLLTTDPNVDVSLFARGTSIESKRGHNRSHSSASSHSSGSKSSQLVEEDGEVGSRVTSPRPRLQTNESTSSVLQHSRSASSGSRNEIEVRDIEVSRQSLESRKEEIVQKELQIISTSEDHPVQTIQSFQSSVKDHLSRILVTEEEGAVIGAAQVMFKVVQQFINSIAEQEMASLTSETVQSSNNNSLIQKCNVLSEKLKSILATLSEEAMATTDPQQMSERPKRVFRPREALMTRADSLKKAVEGVIDLTEKTVDAQEQTTAEVKAMTQTALKKHHQRQIMADQGLGLSARNVSPDQQPVTRISPDQPLASHSDSAGGLPSGTKEISCLNNYLGIGLDAKIAYEFNTRREENPTQYKNRTRNKLLYGYLGGRELFTNTQRYLERRITLECDGKPVQLPQRLQGLVFLNIPSYMAGTNFWGTEREKDGFCAPSMDDKLMEVVGVTGFTHLATTKVLGIQNQRLAQCRYAKVTLSCQLPLQVDGEAWKQEAGTLLISHKNKACMLVKDKAFSQSLESWVSKNPGAPPDAATPTTPTNFPLYGILLLEEIKRYLDVAKAVTTLMDCIYSESQVNNDVAKGLLPLVTTMNLCLERVFPGEEVSKTADLEHLQDFEHSVKALVQETLWYLNMDKVSVEKVDEMRELVQVTETCIKKVILADHSTVTLARRGYRRASDTLLLQRPPSTTAPPFDYSPAVKHRQRATHVTHELNERSFEACHQIGKAVPEWSVDDVCLWLEALLLGSCTDNFRKKGICGRSLLDLQIDDMVALGITKVNQQTRLRHGLQCLQSFVDQAAKDRGP